MGNDVEDPVTEFAKELAKQLPVKDVYKDAAKPAAKQVGEVLEDVVKVVHLALGPVQLLAALQDRFRHFIDRSVRRVPEERRIPPPPQILRPILEGIRYEPEGTPIDEMFSELLTKAVDRDGVSEAHPSFPYLIKQLSSDEAKILVMLRESHYAYVYTLQLDRATMTWPSSSHVTEVDELPRDTLDFPENVDFYMDHLDNLGLAGRYNQGNPLPLLDNLGQQTGNRHTASYRLTYLGERFVRACTRAQ